MVISDRFYHENAIKNLKILWNENGPCFHAALDGFLTEGAPEAVSERDSHKDAIWQVQEALREELFLRQLRHITGYRGLFSGPLVPRQRLTPSSDLSELSNGIERVGTAWKQGGVIIFLNECDSGLEIWHGTGPEGHDLIHFIPAEPNRMVLFDINPGLFYGFRPVIEDMFIFSVPYYVHEMPDWAKRGDPSPRAYPRPRDERGEECQTDTRD